MGKHTPGPWTAFGIDVRSSSVVLEGELVAETRDYPMGSKELEESYANARLIAAAPEILEALKDVVGDCRCSVSERLSGHLLECSVPRALEVIAKAEGSKS